MAYLTVFNPFTKRPDYISTTTTGGTTANTIEREDATDILLEDGTSLLMES